MSERPKQKSAVVGVTAASERLYQTPTKSRLSFHPNEETRATKVVSNEEMEQIISRLQVSMSLRLGEWSVRQRHHVQTQARQQSFEKGVRE